MSGKITASHLQRQAFVYVRQSTSAQVHEHIESKQRQYALAERATSLGWSPGAVEVVDEDQGKSGSSAEGRDGFARLARAVAEGKAGAVFAVEASRLARCSQDWQRLLSLCAVAQVVVVDEQTVYDPSHHDDKLLLDLKGAMSEQELHWLSLRLAGGRLNKARRGESYITPPAGYVWGGHGLELDPDEAVRSAVRVIFERFAVEPSARAVLRWAQASHFLMPTRQRGTSEVLCRPLGNLRLNNMLRNPAYAGVYVYGRHPTRKALVDGEIRKVRKRLGDPSEWPVRIPEAHPAYITWDVYVKNQEKLRLNTTSAARAGRGAPREGQALLSGIALCGRCGRRMSARYDSRASRWHYVCYGESAKGARLCWSVSGRAIDRAVEQLFLRTMVPSELELSLAVEREVTGQADSLDKAWHARIEQAQYEARRAERRYKAVDPDNRVVARTLEGEWENRLRDLEKVELERAQARRQHRIELGPEDRKRIRELAHDLPVVWAASTTSMADRKAMLRLVIEAIALHAVDVPERVTRVRVQWTSGAVSELEVARPGRGKYHKHAPAVLERIRELAATGRRDEEIALKLNAEGLHTGTGLEWNEDHVRAARRSARIGRVAPDRPRKQPLPHRHPDGRYSVPGAMARFGVGENVVRRWISQGIVPTSREDFGTHRKVYWLSIDDAMAARLTESCRNAGKAN
jgi:DNA invertase Pin-like site-specific DNA recombinase/DNA-binding NarL/FixJ family response regulator